ncbi:MAG: leucine-rich repeat domain-containing protein [Bernardetiaceae bacterium]|nr:leucine-rich repeat domain-containing protein [Bernardetiaceae bacterium]
MKFQKIIELLESNQTEQVLKALQMAENHISEFRELFRYAPSSFSKRLLRYLEYGQFNLHLQGTQVYISHTALQKVPSFLFLIKNLSVLSFNANQITEFPERIVELEYLSTLRLCNNQIKEIPTNIKHSFLTSLYLNQNRLSSIPPEIANLKKLRYLSLSNNPFFKTFPIEVCEKSLWQFWFCNNKIKNIPKELAKSVCWDIFLSHNLIESLPSDFFEYADEFLKTLDLRYNRLKTLPDAIIDFRFLKVYVAGNPDLKVSDELRNSGKLIFK